MKIISYRGPDSAGGVSSSLAQAWREYANISDSWCHINQNGLHVLSHSHREQVASGLPEGLIEAHYRYCNEFLWPVMHDMEEHATYVPEHRRQYEQLNAIVSHVVSKPLASAAPQVVLADQSSYFIHDYHFATLPRLLKQRDPVRSASFWHIPWPKTIKNPIYIAPIADIARDMLSADFIGFHIKEYADNFMRFVENNLPEFVCDWEKKLIGHAQYANSSLTNKIDGLDDVSENNKAFLGKRVKRITEITVAPLGIDCKHWLALANQNSELAWQSPLVRPYVFSVDRVDYTKAVDHRLQAIDCFFKQFPHWREKMSFVQVCGRTRPGLAAYDKYWDRCQELTARIDAIACDTEWQPLIWLQHTLSDKQLAKMYRQAAVMLVNPIRDGLNLTAKEYVACQGNQPGVLTLSPGAGSWQELGHYCLPINPAHPEQMAEAINKALNLTNGEKTLRMSLLTDKVQANSLARWWYSMRNKLERKPEQYVGKRIRSSEPLLASQSK